MPITFSDPKMLTILVEYINNRKDCCANIYPVCQPCSLFVEIFNLKKDNIQLQAKIKRLEKEISDWAR